MTLAAQAPGLRLVATDTRWFLENGNRDLANRDLGYKLAHVPGGFVALTGDAYTVVTTIHRLRRTGVEDLADVQHALNDATRGARALGHQCGDITHCFVARAVSCVIISNDGRAPEHVENGKRRTCWPPSLRQSDRDEIDAWASAERANVNTLEVVFRTVARLFAKAHAFHPEGLSDSVEIGALIGPAYLPVYLSGCSAELADAATIRATALEPGKLLPWRNPKYFASVME